MGGPVTFARVSGTGTNPTLPGTAVQYSTLATFGGDTCTDDANFQSTPQTPRSSIKRVRVEYTLPALTRERMYINMQVASAVAPHTVITNNSITTYPGLVTPLTPSETVTVEPETVQVQKSTSTPTLNAGTPGAFTIQGFVQGPGSPISGTITVVDTLPVGLTYLPGSTVLTAPPNPTSWTTGSANATPAITMAGSNQVLDVDAWNLSAESGVLIQLPTIQFQVNTDISLVSGSVINSVTIVDTADGNVGGPNHTATASINVSNSGSFHISKTTPTPTIPTNGTISWALNYANTSGSDSTSTDFIDEIPYSGDVNSSSFHGTLVLATVTPANPAFPITVEYTNHAHGSINIDPGCTSNGGAIAAGTPGTTCQSFTSATWCPALSGPGCPTALAQVTAVRILGGDLPGPSGTRTVNITATTNGNVFTDVYWNKFGARTQFLGLGLISQPVETVVPTPPDRVPHAREVVPCAADVRYGCASPRTDITYGIVATNTGRPCIGTNRANRSDAAEHGLQAQHRDVHIPGRRHDRRIL